MKAWIPNKMKEEPKPWEFRSKPAWQRLIIMLGGVTVNFILAVIIYIGIAYKYGDEYIRMDSLKDGVWVMEEHIGDKAGIKTGDKILAVDGTKLESFQSVYLELINGNSITIERNGQRIEKELPVDFIATLLEDEDKVRFLYPRVPFVVGDIPKESHNKETDLQKSDRIVKIGKDAISYYDEAKPILKQYTGQNVDLEVVRNNGLRKTVAIQVSDSALLAL